MVAHGWTAECADSPGPAPGGGRRGPHSAYNWPGPLLPRAHAATISAVGTMPSPLVVDALREQLVRVLEWYRHERPVFGWGVVLHRRNERGKLRFGAVTPGGESLLLSQPLLSALAEGPCWLDGAVRVRLACRQVTQCHPWLDALNRPDRPPLVEAMAVCFDPDASAAECEAFQTMAGTLTPATLPSELFLLLRKRCNGWPL
jgi:hypothetical protein